MIQEQGEFALFNIVVCCIMNNKTCWHGRRSKTE